MKFSWRKFCIFTSIGIVLAFVSFHFLSKSFATSSKVRQVDGGWDTMLVKCNLPDCAKVSEVKEVEVMNPDGIEGIWVHFYPFKGKCYIEPGGLMTKVKDKDDSYPVKYDLAGAHNIYCPDGTIFFIGKDEFNGSTDRYASLMAKVNAERKEVQALLSR